MSSKEISKNLLSYELSLRDETKRMLAATSSGDTEPSPGTSIRNDAPSVAPSGPAQSKDIRHLQEKEGLPRFVQSGRGEFARHFGLNANHRPPSVRRRRSIGLGQISQTSSPAISPIIQISGITPPTPGSAVSPEGFPSTPLADQESRGGSPDSAATSRAQRPAWMRTRSGGV